MLLPYWQHLSRGCELLVTLYRLSGTVFKIDHTIFLSPAQHEDIPGLKS